MSPTRRYTDTARSKAYRQGGSRSPRRSTSASTARTLLHVRTRYRARCSHAGHTLYSMRASMHFVIASATAVLCRPAETTTASVSAASHFKPTTPVADVVRVSAILIIGCRTSSQTLLRLSPHVWLARTHSRPFRTLANLGRPMHRPTLPGLGPHLVLKRESGQTLPRQRASTDQHEACIRTDELCTGRWTTGRSREESRYHLIRHDRTDFGGRTAGAMRGEPECDED